MYFVARCGTTLAGGAGGQTQRAADRHAMGEDRTASPSTAPFVTRRTATREQSRGGRRHSLGVEDGRALARPARRIPQRIHLLAPIAPVGRGWDVAAHVARLPRPARRAWAASVGERVHRRVVRVGEKGGSDIGRTPRGKGSKWMVVVDGQGIPLGIHVASARPAEVTLVDATLNTIRVPRVGRGRPRMKPDRLIADRGYDSDPLRQRLARRGVTAIVPYRNWNLQRRYDDGRRLRRYRHRWIIERTFAWLGSFRRLLVRHERLTSMYCSLLYFAAALIALRRF